MKNIQNISIVMLLLAAMTFALYPVGKAKAQAGTAMDLIGAVNALRSESGLEPYTVDSNLMSLSQDQSDYQASIQTCTHTRADGSGPGEHGIAAENIACGNDLSVQEAIQGQWTDNLHMATMLGPSSGVIGAGVATAGGKVYYTLQVNRLAGEFIYNPPANAQSQSAQQEQPAQVPVGAFATSTPNDDGSIAHVVKYGDTLVEIAKTYGISLSDLIGMNKLDPNNPAIYEHQVLIIQLAFTKTPFITATYTPRPPTRTPMPTRTPRPTRTPAPVYTPLPTRTDTPEPLFKVPTMEDLGPGRPIMAYAFIGISLVGLIVLIFTAFLPGKKP